MSDPGTRITLDLRPNGGPVEGRVAAAGKEPREFSGYAGLIAALESIRATDGGHRNAQLHRRKPDSPREMHR
jgi:hypothetical protein